MKKRAKLIAVLSATAILAVGGTSMTSFAASGWVEENDGWAYFDENGIRVKEQWVESGGAWFWLDDSGQMAVDQLLEIDENYYYVGADGGNVTNQWIAIENEDAGAEDEPERHWYYFQDSGKACKRSNSTSSGAAKARVIDGKRYAFDTEGRMLYGWVSDGERQTGEDAWKTCDYYFGGPDDGAMRIGWERIFIVDENAEKVQPGEDFWEAEQNRWFYFSETGKKTKGDAEGFKRRTLDGNKYAFDEYGRMIVSWYADPNVITTEYAKESEAYDSDSGQGGKNYSKRFMYFGAPESGIQYVNGWFRAVPGLYLMQQKHLDGESAMYYADSKGYICANEIRTIDQEMYAFDNYGRQLTGFVCLTMADNGGSKYFNKKAHADDATTPFSTVEEFEETVDAFAEEFSNHEKRFYLFYGPNNTMLTGLQKVTIDGEKVDFLFETSGYRKGSGVMGKKDGRLYQAGRLLKADAWEKYAIYKQDLNYFGMFYKMTVEEFMDENCEYGVREEKKKRTVWEALKPTDNVKYYLVDTNGKIIKIKTRARESDGYEITVKGEVIKSITMYD